MTHGQLHEAQQKIVDICAKALPIEVIHRKSGNRNIATTKRHVRSLVQIGRLIEGDKEYQAATELTGGVYSEPAKTKKAPSKAAKVAKPKEPAPKPEQESVDVMTVTTTSSSFVRDEKVKFALESLPSVFEKKTIKHEQPLLSLAIKKQALAAIGQFLDPSIDDLFSEIARDLDSLDLLLTKVAGQ